MLERDALDVIVNGVWLFSCGKRNVGFKFLVKSFLTVILICMLGYDLVDLKGVVGFKDDNENFKESVEWCCLEELVMLEGMLLMPLLAM